MDNPFSWDYLTTRPGSNEVFGAFAIGFLIIFGFGFLISLILYSGGGRAFVPNPVLRRMAHRWAVFGLLVFGVGLFFFLIRLLQINPLNFGYRIWLWLSLLAALILALYITYDLWAHYSENLAQYEERRRKQQYLRPSSSGAAALGRSGAAGTPLVSGARPVKRKRR